MTCHRVKFQGLKVSLSFLKPLEVAAFWDYRLEFTREWNL